MATEYTAEQLLERIQQYKQTRRVSAKSMHCWLDTLIADAEAKIRNLGGTPDSAREAPVPAAGFPRLHVDRNAYPLDERAPRQRIP